MTRTKMFAFTVLITVLLLIGSASAAHITISPVTVNAGGTATATVTLDAVPPEGLAGYNLALNIADPAKAQITGVTFNPSLGGLTGATSAPFTSGYIQWADTGNLIDYGDTSTNLVLATLTISGVSSGSTTLGSTISELTADDADGIGCSPTTGNGCDYPDLTGSSTIDSPAIVVRGSGAPAVTLVSLPGSGTPRDLDGDGLYEDLNGDGIHDYQDTVLYFNNFDWIGENEPVSLFDFNGNGMIDFGDIVELNTKR